MKKNGFLRGTILVLLVCCILCGLSACSFLTFGGLGGEGSKGKDLTVTLHIEGYEITDFVSKTDHIIKKPETDPIKEGYDFVMWCSDEECTQELPYGEKLVTDLDVYPKWTVKTMTVTLVDAVAQTSSAIHTAYDTAIALPTKQSAGYNFIGWYTDEDCHDRFSADTKITADLTLYAGWEAIDYTISYTLSGGTLETGAPRTYTMFSATTLPDCQREGYTFVGWFNNPGLTGTAITEIPKGNQGPKYFYAKYVCNLAEASAKFNSVTVTEDSVSFSVKYTQSTIDLTEYLTFSEKATYAVSDSGGPVSSIALAENVGDDNILHEYTLTVTAENGTTQKEYSLTITQFTGKQVVVTYYVGNNIYYRSEDRQAGDKAETVDDPDPDEGYTFGCWCVGSVDGEEYDFNSILVADEDVDLYAKFDPIEYNIYYVLGYGDNDVSNFATYTVEDAVTFADALSTSEEHTFAGWYNADYSEQITGIPLGTTGDLTLYARYTLINKTIVDFSGRTEITLAELNDYFVYAMYNRMSDIQIRITGGEPNEELRPYMESAFVASNYVDGAEGHGVDGSFSVTADSNGVWNIHFSNVDYNNAPNKNATGGTYPQTEPYAMHLSETGRAADFNDFAIEHIADTLVVNDTEQLVYAVEHGYRPVPTAQSAAESVYNKAKIVLRSIIDDDMSDYEKALAIYEYLIENVSYDHETFDRVIHNELTAEEAMEYYCFYLDGVFDSGLAVCDGYSKAFMLLARIEGIRAIQVEGSAIAGGSGHAWNRVCLAENGIDRKWYVVDCTSGDTLVSFSEVEAKEVMTHAYFLYTDEVMATRYNVTDDEFSAYVAEDDGNYYASTYFTWEDEDYSCLISNDQQMAACMSYLISCAPADKSKVSMDVKIDNGYDPDPFVREHNKITGIRQSIIDGLGVVINGYNFSWTQSADTGCYTFLCSRK